MSGTINPKVRKKNTWKMEKAAMTCPHIAQQTMIRFSVLQELGKIWRMGMSEDERDYFTKFGTSI